MKNVILFVFCFITVLSTAQVKWQSSTKPFTDIRWDNYSTSFIEPGKLSVPIIITAIPYNGIYSNFEDISELNLSFDSALFRFRSNLSNRGRRLYTYDSSEVYFLAPGIFRSNAKYYQYRLLLNGQTVLKPWQDITNFADSLFQLNDFKKGMAFLGGYKTTWNNYLLVQLKRKEADTLTATAMVYWKPIKPTVQDIYTVNELNSFLGRLKKPYDYPATNEDLDRWKKWYPARELDSSSGLPKRLLLNADEDNIIFYLQGDIYKKEALEYQLLKDGKIAGAWKSNDFDNNFIWLKKLKPGEYELQMRFRSQRHNISSYPFYIRQEWFDTPAFKIVVLAIAVFILLLAFWLWRQKQKTIFEKRKKEKLNLELKALRAQLNPHFVFNALSSIQGLVHKNELDAVNHYLTEFSTLLRGSLKNKDAEYTSLDQELKMLETYIRLEQLRFHFQYHISVDGKLPVNAIEIPSLLMQPLVENAIKHGAGPRYEKGKLGITFSVNGKDLLVDIADNGTGFPITGLNTGFGIRLVGERVQLLNDTLTGQQIRLSFAGNKNESTVVHLIFENWL